MEYFEDTIDKRLDLLIRIMDAQKEVSRSVNFPMLGKETHSYTKGKKYARVSLSMSNGQRCVVCFVSLDTGDVWKPDGWKGPALNFPRGNINSQSGRKAFSEFYASHIYGL